MTQDLKAIESTAEDKRPGRYVHKLAQPFTWEGQTYDAFTFDFDALTGRDMINVETEMVMLGEPIVSPELSTGFAYRLAARAAGVPDAAIENLPVGEFNTIRRTAKNFMTGR